MQSKELLFSKLTPKEREEILESILVSNHKEVIAEIFAFLEALIADLQSSKITMSVLKQRLFGFLSEKRKKAGQTP